LCYAYIAATFQETTPMRAVASLAGLALLATEAMFPAFGQSSANPSADQIVHSLTPSGTLGDATRGIRIGTPQGGLHTAQPPTAAPSVNLTVDFATGSASLTPAAMRTLDALGEALNNPTLAPYHFRIEGHTDTVGSKDMNQTLSERRADSVVGYLSARYHISSERLQAVGMGEANLLVPTPDQTPEPRNRRVVVVNVGS
jgi:OmpA-OmpF porin, OOP family